MHASLVATLVLVLSIISPALSAPVDSGNGPARRDPYNGNNAVWLNPMPSSGTAALVATNDHKTPQETPLGYLCIHCGSSGLRLELRDRSTHFYSYLAFVEPPAIQPPFRLPCDADDLDEGARIPDSVVRQRPSETAGISLHFGYDMRAGNFAFS
ncbi:hypothetical protein V8E53_009054 [Lactarius tabidus]